MITITPRKVIKAVIPYGALVLYRKYKPFVAQAKQERGKKTEFNRGLSEILRDAKPLKANQKPKIVVSLTSYGTRLTNTAPLAIASLFRQKVLPDKVVLWLAEGEKPSKDIQRMTKLGLDIEYCEDIKSYKKLIPALEKYPNSVIITADDDVIYPEDWLSKTLAAHKKYPNTILTHRARSIKLDDQNEPLPYLDWPILEDNLEKSRNIVPTGVSGILYPPNSFIKEVFNKKQFTSLAPHADDLWFWAMSELKGTKRAVIKDGFQNILEVELDPVGMSNTLNFSETTGNDAQFANILLSYPKLGKKIGAKVNVIVTGEKFLGSEKYWEDRYKLGGNSGAGSYDNLAEFKAEVLNEFVDRNHVKTVIEFGVGDGNQLKLANYPHFIGLDVSETAINICRKMFRGDRSKEFYTLDKYDNQKAELTMSLDVLYHLIEQDVFEEHIKSLFESSTKYVIVYAADSDDYKPSEHVLSRKFTRFIEQNIKGWKLVEHIPNKYPYDESNPHHTSWADFYIYQKSS